MFNPNTLLILGNGFDLHCGLKSSYKDFFRSEILDTTTESFDIKQLKDGVTGFWESLLFEYYKTYDKDDYKWCDIERIIKDTLLSVFINKIYASTELWRIAYNNAYSGLKPKEIIPSIKSPTDSFLFNDCIEFYRTLSVRSCEEAEGKLATLLLQQLNNLEKRFCKYLKNQIINENVDNGIVLNTDYIVNAANLLVKLTGFSNSTYSSISKIIKQKYGEWKEKDGSTYIGYFDALADEFSKLKTISILSFNYTALFDILSVESPCIYNNVHGKLCNEHCARNCNSSNIIFGIDDTLIQENPEAFALRVFSKTYRKMHAKDKPSNILPMNNNSQVEIKFFGHSLSEADYSYFQSIFDYYDLYGNTNVSLTFYYSEGYEQNDDIYKLISSYGKTLNNKEHGKNLIHKLLLENRLKIKKI